MVLNDVVIKKRLSNSTPSDNILILKEDCFLKLGDILTIRKYVNANGSNDHHLVVKNKIL
jgi:hypothetical protein